MQRYNPALCSKKDGSIINGGVVRFVGVCN